MKSASDIMEQFGLTNIDNVPRMLITRRIQSLAEYCESYEASFEKLSRVLHKRTGKLREAEDRETEANKKLEALQILAAKQAHILMAVWNWEAAIGTKTEAQMMADLRETMAVYRYEHDKSKSDA